MNRLLLIICLCFLTACQSKEISCETYICLVDKAYQQYQICSSRSIRVENIPNSRNNQRVVDKEALKLCSEQLAKQLNLIGPLAKSKEDQ